MRLPLNDPTAAFVPGWCCLAALIAALALGGCAAFAPRPPAPSIAEVVQMSKEGRAPESIVKLLQDAGAVYPLPGSELARLKGEGVADPVLDWLLEAQIRQARMEEWLRGRSRMEPSWLYGYPGYRGPVPPVPTPPKP